MSKHRTSEACQGKHPDDFARTTCIISGNPIGLTMPEHTLDEFEPAHGVVYRSVGVVSDKFIPHLLIFGSRLGYDHRHFLNCFKLLLAYEIPRSLRSVRWFRNTCLFGVLMLAGLCHARAAATLPEIIAQVKPSIVAIGTVLSVRRPPNQFRATAFVVADGRHAITNAHALPRSGKMVPKESLAIFVPGVKGARKARTVATDNEHDLALIAFDGPALKAMTLGTSQRVLEGETYVFTGFPIGGVLGLYPVSHRAMVSAITPIAIPQLNSRGLTSAMVRRLDKPYTVFQLDATAYPGNSGSPLFDTRTARVIGVINKVLVSSTRESALENPTGISYAIPVVHAYKLLAKAGLTSKGGLK
jgi:serine protease Do